MTEERLLQIAVAEGLRVASPTQWNEDVFRGDPVYDGHGTVYIVLNDGEQCLDDLAHEIGHWREAQRRNARGLGQYGLHPDSRFETGYSAHDNACERRAIELEPRT